MTETYEILKPSPEIAATLVGRIGAMTKDQLEDLDKVMTPEISKTFALLLPELQVLFDTVEHAEETKVDTTPKKAMLWWERNNWFNGVGFERETAAARAIDVQLDLEGYDKNSDEYYERLDQRLHVRFPNLNVKH
jgi:predicted membrane protein